MNIATSCYTQAKTFPRDGMYGMTAPIRRAAVSVPANIAEGQGREQTGSFLQFLRIAQGSLKELETHLLLAERVEFMTSQASQPLLLACDELGRMLRALIRSLEAKQGA